MKDRWEMRHMNLQIAAANSVVTGVKSCILCNKDFEYAANVSGDKNVEDLSLIYKGKSVSDQVIVLKKSWANNGTLQLVDVEITVKCPHCYANHRFNQFLTLEI